MEARIFAPQMKVEAVTSLGMDHLVEGHILLFDAFHADKLHELEVVG